MSRLHILHGFFMEEFPLFSGAIIAENFEVIEEVVPCEGRVSVENAWIDYHGYPLHRPFIRLSGVVEEVQGDFPLNIADINFDMSRAHAANDGRVEFSYEFSDEELAVLASIGLWSHQLVLPKNITHNYYRIPLRCPVKIVTPVKAEDAPLVFVSLKTPPAIISAKSSSYQLASLICEAYGKENALPPADTHTLSSSSNDISAANIVADTTALHNATISNSDVKHVSSHKSSARSTHVSDKSLETRKKALKAAQDGRNAAMRRSLLSKGELDEPTTWKI